MKIARYRDAGGGVHHGQLLDDGRLERLSGDLYGCLIPSGEMVESFQLLAPLDPRAVLCIGLNYHRHAEELGAPVPEYPVVFMKSPAAVQNPGDPIELPTSLASEQVDYEGELAVVIGRRCKNLAPAQAPSVILGYTCANDISARDWQQQKRLSGGQWCRSKSFDTFLPLGPTIVSLDAFPDPHNLNLHTRLNGATVQHANTADMIFSVCELVAFLSGSTTLLPGMVILTGTPAGVGMAARPPRWLQPGDEVSVEIEGIGCLTNPVIAEPVGLEQSSPGH